MNTTYISKIAGEIGVQNAQVEAVAVLLSEGATVPFIARYRKEATGTLDEVAITTVRDRLAQLAELDARKETVLKSLEQHGHLTDELKDKVLGAETMTVLEDIYLPYKPKRRTRAIIAKEKGLEPLALLIFDQGGRDIEQAAAAFVNAEKGVESVEDALSGARDIIAEMINEHEQARASLRQLFADKGKFKSTVASGKESEGAKYKDYFEWEEPVAAAPSHRILAMRRGEKEDILNLSVNPPEEDAIELLKRLFIKGQGQDSKQVEAAIEDCYKRLMSRSMETEIRVMTKERADAEAIRVFAENLRNLLMSAPLGAKRVMGVDPGFRTGCKIVCLDAQGKLLHHDTIYLHEPERAAVLIKKMCEHFEIQAIAVGNGTASRESEAFLKAIPFEKPIQILMVIPHLTWQEKNFPILI